MLDLVKWYIDVPVAEPNLAASLPSPRVDSKGVVQLATNSYWIADNNMIGQDQFNTYIDPSKLHLQAQPRGGKLDDLEDLSPKDTRDDATGSAWIAPGTGRSDTLSHVDSSYVCLRKVRDEPNVIMPTRPAKKPRARARNPVLEEWLLANAAYPYPDADQLSALSQLSGRSLRQTRNALSNLRARKRPDLSTNPTCAGLTAYSGHSNAPRMAYCSETTSPTISTANHATPYGIGAYPSPMSTLNDVDHDFRHNCFETSERSAPDEIMGRNRSIELDGAFSPAAPTEGAISLRRKGKRKHGSRYEACDLNLDSSTRHNKAELNSLTTGAPRFHCTVCPKSFKNAWGWRRHEYGTHDFHPVEWTCMLHAAIMIGMDCIFCSQPVDDYDHFDQHNIVACSQRDPASRTFALEDRLKQHVQQIHLLEVDDKLKKGFKPPALWSRAVEAEKIHPDSLWCGFCCIGLQSTTLRMDHVAQHFRDGLSMVGWSRRPIDIASM
ncbi:hypothetical protein FB567DRAFT_523649 [Paraphoma chrysanthemicola]|uniref:C2H2-type domain-containing protein n=1 Tax=Paraphoma chrysanthemicola TaxID=798071 RepID=A0A8K0R9C1_9PLEO|nr:hypothetical protein FB567DRAFT_523649 [Paraphoma chrysanthemicola]